MGNKNGHVIIQFITCPFLFPIHLLYQWCKKWRVIINTNKSKIVYFRRRRTQRTNYAFKVGNNVLETVNQYRYLGVIFEEHNDFGPKLWGIIEGSRSSTRGSNQQDSQHKGFPVPVVWEIIQCMCNTDSGLYTEKPEKWPIIKKPCHSHITYTNNCQICLFCVPIWRRSSCLHIKNVSALAIILF